MGDLTVEHHQYIDLVVKNSSHPNTAKKIEKSRTSLSVYVTEMRPIRFFLLFLLISLLYLTNDDQRTCCGRCRTLV